MAFREYEDLGVVEKATIYLLYLKSALRSRLDDSVRKTFDQFTRISLKERRALDELAAAMGTRYMA